MNRISEMSLYSLIIVLFVSHAACAAPSEAQDKSTQQTIAYLIRAVATSHLTFIRNGERHTSDEAARHMMEKYDTFKSRVKTSEDFIRLCCSKSLLSGMPYQVETDRGAIRTEVWLNEILAKYRLSKKPF